MASEGAPLDKTPKKPLTDGGPPDYRGLTLGLEFGLTIIVFVAIGYFADLKLDTSPWFLVASLFLGFIGALYSLVRKADRGSKSDVKDSNPKAPKSPRN